MFKRDIHSWKQQRVCQEELDESAQADPDHVPVFVTGCEDQSVANLINPSKEQFIRYQFVLYVIC